MQRTGVAIKCNFCNGGSDIDKFHYGYNGVCSKDVIKHNIETARYDWCSHPRCACNRFNRGEITYEQLRQEYEKDRYSICYESVMIDKWEASAGWDHNGVRGERPRKMLGAEVGSLAVLTLVTPNSFENERRVFALFLIDEYFVGDDENEGYIASKSKHRLHFTRKETNDLRFWSFYENENTLDKRWGSGLYRYLSDEQSINILNQVIAVKAGTEDELLAKEIFDVFCKNRAVKPKS